MWRELSGLMTIFDLETMHQDYFALFGLARSQGLDVDALDALYRDIQAQVHPDKHAHLSPAEQRMAMQWATRVNEAWQTLRDPLRRARYLLQLAGHDIALESNTAMPASFLMAQMELRERVAEARARKDADALDLLHREIKKTLFGEHALLGQLLDAGEMIRSAEVVRQLMFYQKLREEIENALEAVET